MKVGGGRKRGARAVADADSPCLDSPREQRREIGSLQPFRRPAELQRRVVKRAGRFAPGPPNPKRGTLPL